MNLRSSLYRTARVLGDINAIARGRIVHRVARKALWRLAARVINRIIPPR